MVEFLYGASAGATVALVLNHIATKYLANIEAKIKADIKADLADAEALKKSAEAEVARLKQDAEAELAKIKKEI